MRVRRRLWIGLPVLGVVAGLIGWLVDPDTGSVSDAVAAGDIERLDEALAEGADPNGPIEGGLTPLMRAATRDDTAAIRLLLDAGAEIDGVGLEGQTPLHVAARANAADAVEVLISAGADPDARSANGMAVVHHAAAVGASGVIDRLVTIGVEVDSPSTVITQGHGHPRDVGATALSIAARADQVDAVRSLLRGGADVDGRSERGITALLAAVFGDAGPETVAVLIEAGADPSVTIGCESGCAVSEPMDAFGWAVELGRTEVAGLLGG